MLPERAFNKVRFTLEGGGKNDSPPPPDYAGAAQATAAGNLEATRAAAAANRVNQVTPYGSLTYSRTPTGSFDQAGYDRALATYNAAQAGGLGENSKFAGVPGYGVAPDRNNFYNNGGEDDGWTATQTLSPEQQKILDSTNKLNLGLMDTAGRGLTYANDVLSKPGVDTSKLPQVGINPGQSYQDAMMARLDPAFNRQSDRTEQNLANQGIARGSEAWNDAQRQLGEDRNDAYNQATVQGFNTGMAANQNAFQQTAYNQMQPINVINALRTGSQVQNPNFVNVPQQATAAGPDLLGAAQGTYQAQLNAANAKNAASGNFQSGLFSLGAAAMSDRRLKKNIQVIGMRDDGLPVYEYEYKDGHGLPAGKQIGLMADEVEKVIPNAVMTHASGYKMVNYALTGGAHG
jgi:hypothetical protein